MKTETESFQNSIFCQILTHLLISDNRFVLLVYGRNKHVIIDLPATADKLSPL